jgi:hypothetical protein
MSSWPSDLIPNQLLRPVKATEADLPLPRVGIEPDAPKSVELSINPLQPVKAASAELLPVQAGAEPEAPKTIPDKLAVLDQRLDAISKSLTVTTADPNIKLVLGGAVIADFLYSRARPVAPGTPFFLTPGPPPDFRQQTFDASARQTVLSAYVVGPEFCGFETSGLILVNLYSSSLVEDLYGILPIQAYAQMKNDQWRFAAGLQMDIFNPLNPTVLPFSLLGAAGNTGAFRGQLRAERFFRPFDHSDITLIAGISDPLPTSINNLFRVNEDNGWPNIEGRAAWAFGPMTGERLEMKRPFEWGVSGLVGQIRTTLPGATQVVTDTWGLGTDLRWAANDRFGVQGELFTGRTLGTYMGGILQNVNSTTFQGIHTSGGWVEGYYYLCPNTLHMHVGYGIDDPRDSDLAPGQSIRNEAIFANLIWDPTNHCRVAFELTYRWTAYNNGFRNNEGVGVHTQFQLKF